DLGPEAGPNGGEIVAQGTPEEVCSPASPKRARNGQPMKPLSHTAEALAPVLAAGPRQERVVYDPLAAAAPKEGDIALEAVGKDHDMPWQTDGRRWHTRDRLTTEGKPCRWEGEILTWIDDRVHEAGDFGDTVWNQRSVVEIPAQKSSLGWFLHAMTSMEWLLR